MTLGLLFDRLNIQDINYFCVIKDRGSKNGKNGNYNIGRNRRRINMAFFCVIIDGKKNVALAITIFVVMVFLTLGIAYPDVRIVLEW